MGVKLRIIFIIYLDQFEALFFVAKTEKFESFLSVDRKSAHLEGQFINELKCAEQVTQKFTI